MLLTDGVTQSSILTGFLLVTDVLNNNCGFLYFSISFGSALVVSASYLYMACLALYHLGLLSSWCVGSFIKM